MKFKHILFFFFLTLFGAICLKMVQKILKSSTTDDNAEIVMRYISCICFALYITCILYITFFSRNTRPREIRLDPFYRIKQAISIQEQSMVIYYRPIYESILNIIMMSPFGYFIPLIWKKFERKGFIVVFLGFVFSVCIEVFQYITYKGMFEVTDIIHNTLGCLFGVMTYRLLFQEGIHNIIEIIKKIRDIK